MQMLTLEDRCIGSFLGQAVGDALGSPIEFMPADMIYQFFGGPEELCKIPPCGGTGECHTGARSPDRAG